MSRRRNGHGRTLLSLIDAYDAQCALLEIGDSSRRTYRRNLRTWHAWRQAEALADAIHAVTMDELRRYFAYLKDTHVPHSGNPARPPAQRVGLAPATRNLHWRVLAGFWSFCAGEGYLTPDQTTYFTSGRLPKPKVPSVKRQGVEAATVVALLATCDATVRGLRDRALILLLEQTGCRITELVTLSLARCDLDGQSALVHGKGGKDRRVYWRRDATDAIRAYLATRRQPARDAWLFIGYSSRSKGHLSAEAVRDMLKDRARQAGVTLPKNQPCHGFRRGFARRMSRAGMPLVHLQQVLGHASLQYLAVYADEDEDAPIEQSYRAVMGE